MAITPVQRIQKRDTSDLGKAQALGTVLSLIPTPATQMAGAAITAGSLLAPGPKQPQAPAPTLTTSQPALDMPDRSLAIQRRSDLGQQDPVEGLIQARESLAQLDLEPEQRARLQKPLDLALQAQRRV